jgi:hypothetical protein
LVRWGGRMTNSEPARVSGAPAGVRLGFWPKTGGLHCVATSGYCLSSLPPSPRLWRTGPGSRCALWRDKSAWRERLDFAEASAVAGKLWRTRRRGERGARFLDQFRLVSTKFDQIRPKKHADSRPCRAGRKKLPWKGPHAKVARGAKELCETFEECNRLQALGNGSADAGLPCRAGGLVEPQNFLDGNLRPKVRLRRA